MVSLVRSWARCCSCNIVSCTCRWCSDKDKFIVVAGVSESEVNTDVVSAIVTLLSEEAVTDNDTDEPADTVPMLPAPVENLVHQKHLK
jgi:hypothetical protein